MLDNAKYAEVAEKLTPGDFSLDSNKIIFRAMGRLIKAASRRGVTIEGDDCVNIVTLIESLTQSKELGSIGGRPYLCELTEGLPRHLGIGEFCRLVKEKAGLRTLGAIGAALAGSAYDSSATVAESIAQAQSRLAGVEKNCDPNIAARKPDLVRLSDVAAKDVNWLWKLYLAFGMLAMLSGDPGSGKTFIALALAAGYTVGRTPDGGRSAPIDVLYMSVENAPAEVVRPRFDGLGGDAKRFHLLRGTTWTEDGVPIQGAITLSDIPILDAALEQTRAKLLIVDPIQSYLGASVDLHRSNETRPVLDGLAKLAEKHGCAILILRHLSKQGGGKAITRGLGSIDLSGAVRSEMLAGSLPDDPESRAMVHIKSNLGAYGPTLGYSIDADGKFSWTGRSEITASDLLAAPEGQEKGPMNQAKEWLSALLKDGSKDYTEISQLAEGEGIKIRTLRRAKDALGIHSRKACFGGGWIWSLEGAIEDGEK
jgi:hypothetical protein